MDRSKLSPYILDNQDEFDRFILILQSMSISRESYVVKKIVEYCNASQPDAQRNVYSISRGWVINNVDDTGVQMGWYHNLTTYVIPCDIQKNYNTPVIFVTRSRHGLLEVKIVHNWLQTL
jgi:hypothetical protein